MINPGILASTYITGISEGKMIGAIAIRSMAATPTTYTLPAGAIGSLTGVGVVAVALLAGCAYCIYKTYCSKRQEVDLTNTDLPLGGVHAP